MRHRTVKKIPARTSTNPTIPCGDIFSENTKNDVRVFSTITKLICNGYAMDSFWEEMTNSHKAFAITKTTNATKNSGCASAAPQVFMNPRMLPVQTRRSFSASRKSTIESVALDALERNKSMDFQVMALGGGCFALPEGPVRAA